MPNTYFWRKLHSFLGLFPIGVFLFEHMFVNSLALKGEAAFNRGVAFLQGVPYLWLVELVLIFLPLLFHAFYGIYIVYLTKNNVLSYTYFRNWLFYLQRITALVTLAFVAWHVFVLRLGFSGEISYAAVSQTLSNPVVTALYVIGLFASFSHFANGTWSFFVSWGITIGERAQKTTAYICAILFVFLTVVGLKALNAFV
ncbi:MAG: succinate dehydrogenase [Desulfitobacterium hafniense]|nr:succinate dehydrogenase [Desulfitobacterium hafniense]